MSERKFIEGKIRRDTGMEPEKAGRLANQMLAADDLYWFCPVCSFKNTGTLAELEKGCIGCLK